MTVIKDRRRVKLEDYQPAPKPAPAADAPAADGKPANGVSDAGTKGAPGKSDEKMDASLVAAESVLAQVLAEYKELREVLVADLAKEKEAAQKKDDYAHFKPLLVYIGEATKDIFTGLGFDAAKPGFDATKIDVSKFLEGLSLVIACMQAKPAFWDVLFKGLRSWMRRKFGLPEADADAPKKDDPEYEKKRKEEQLAAVITLVLGLFKLLLLCRTIVGEPEPKPEDPKTSEVFGKYADAAKDIVTACLTLFATSYGKDLMDKLAAKLEVKEEWDFYSKEERHRQAMEDLGNRDKATVEEARKDRDAARKADSKKTETSRDVKQVMKVLNGLAALVKSWLALAEAYRAAFPEDLSGTWAVEGLADEGARVTLLELKKGAGEGKFAGTMSSRGYPPGETPANADMAAILEPITEEKLDLDLLKMPDDTCYVEWKPKGDGKEKPKLPSSLDGAPKGQANFAVSSTRHLFAAQCALAAVVPGKTTRELHLRRPLAIGKIFELLGAGLKALAAIPAAMPSAWERPLRLKFAKAFEPSFVMFKNRVEAFIPKPVRDHVTLEWEDGKLKIGFGSTEKGLGVAAGWDVAKVLQYFSDEITGVPPEDKHPFKPDSFSAEILIPKIYVGASLEWEAWDPAKAAEGGKKGLLEKLPKSELVTAWEDHLKELGCALDILAPEVHPPGEKGELPWVGLPVVFCIGALKRETDTIPVYSKFTLTLKLTAAAIVNLFPPLRALLMAAEVGWAAGTMIRELALQHPEYVKFESDAQSWIADKGWGTDFKDKTNALHQRMGELHRQLEINGLELLMADVKGPFYIWRKDNILDAARQKRPPEAYDPKHIDDISKILRAKLDALKSRAASAKPAHVWDTTFIHTPAQAMLYIYLWGAKGACTRDEVEAEVRAEMKSGDLRGSTGNLYLAYLYPETAVTADVPAEKCFGAHIHAAVDAAKAEIAAAAKRRSPTAGAISTAEPQRVLALADRGYNAFRELVEVLNEPMPDTNYENKFEVASEGDHWIWAIERQIPDEMVHIRLWGSNWTEDSIVEWDDHYDKVPGAGRRHRIVGRMAGLFDSKAWKANVTSHIGGNPTIDLAAEIFLKAAKGMEANAKTVETSLWKSPKLRVTLAPAADGIMSVAQV